MISFTAKKRGEIVRRYRKVKGAALNISIGLLAVAALLTLGLGTNVSIGFQNNGGNAQKGGGTEVLPARKVIQPVEYTEVYQKKPMTHQMNQMNQMQPMHQGGYEQSYGQYGVEIDPGLANLAPVYGGGASSLHGAPTVVDPAYAVIANPGPVAVAPTVLY